MPLQNDIETVVAMIETGRIAQATAVWQKLRGQQKCCAPCFYSPLDDSVRCASCLESNLSSALLKRGYTRVPPDRLALARDRLSQWIGDQAALPQTG